VSYEAVSEKSFCNRLGNCLGDHRVEGIAAMNDEQQTKFLSELNKAQIALMVTLIALGLLGLCGGFFFLMYLILKITEMIVR